MYTADITPHGKGTHRFPALPAISYYCMDSCQYLSIFFKRFCSFPFLQKRPAPLLRSSTCQQKTFAPSSVVNRPPTPPPYLPPPHHVAIVVNAAVAAIGTPLSPPCLPRPKQPSPLHRFRVKRTPSTWQRSRNELNSVG